MIKEAVVKIQLDKDFIVEQIQQFIKQNNYVLITEEEYNELLETKWMYEDLN